MKKYGHVIGLNLSRERNDLPPLTIDGVPFTAVGPVTVDAAPGKAIRVTVEFHASHITGVEPPSETTDTPEFDTFMTYPKETP